MALETETGNLVLFTDYISAQVVPFFRARNVIKNFITVEELASGSVSKKFQKNGGHTADVVAQSGTATASERTDTATTLTVQKAMVYYKPSIESVDFSREDELRRHRDEAVNALLTKFEVDALALSAGASQSVGSTGVDLTPAVFRNGAFLAGLTDTPEPLNAFLSNTQLYDLGDDVATSTALYHSGGNDASVANAQSNVAKPLPSLFGIPIYATNNVPTANASADYSGLICSKNFICAIWNPDFKVLATEVPSNGTYEISISMYYQVGELVDSAGCRLLSNF
jgi:hypothetical protein